MTVGDLLSRVSSSELTEWMAYLSIKNEAPAEGDKNSAKDAMTAVFAHRIKRKAQDGDAGVTRKP